MLPEYNNPQPETRDDESGSNSSLAIVEYSYINFADYDTVEKYAQAKVLVVNAPLMWTSGFNEGAIAQLKAVNPELKVIGYINAHSSWYFWGDEERIDPEIHSYQADWYAATLPYWSYTTAGDTMSPWPGKVVVNILDPNCREAMVDVLADHWTAHSNVFDGIFWDHFNESMWVWDQVPNVDGDLDLDGNGIAHTEDADERQAYRDASVALIEQVREVLGDDVIQITNGNRAARDSVFASLVDGAMYENFPDVGFYGGGMFAALDINNPGNLFAASKWARTQNGGPYQIYSNKTIARYVDENGEMVEARNAEFSRVVALLTGGMASYHSNGTDYGWPDIEVDLGAPVSGAKIVGQVIRRQFENGHVMLDFTYSNDRIPFGFEIHQEGKIIQSLAVPVVKP